MTIEFDSTRARLLQTVGVDDAEQLLEWLQRTPGASVDFELCTHLHPANLQVLMAGATPVCTWPQDPLLAAWLQSALHEQS